MIHRTKRSPLSIAAAAVVLILFTALFPTDLSAQSTTAGPALGVARISLVGGEVTAKRGDSGDWVAASINQPVVEGDSIMTGPGSRAEVQLDYGNWVRLSSNSEVEFASLGNRKFQIRILSGSVGYSELRDSAADVDLETPLVAVRPTKHGRYRIDLGPAETVVTVRNGTAEVASVNGLETLGNGRMMIVRQGPDGPEFRLTRADPKDDWDRWAESRDNMLGKSKAYRYVSRDIYGAEALDDHGDWRYMSGYGYSWFPRTASGWSPYRQGRWTWLDYYGWSWVGSEPWGWAPYHWGRWYHHASYGWGWYPGSPYRRHIWRPALVSFFGYNNYGNIGWCPLGPGELYSPWYGSGLYGNPSNRTIFVDNSVNIYNTYRNARAPNGVTVVDAQGFSRGLVNNPQTLRSVELARATSIRGQIPVVPERGSQGRIVRTAATPSAGGVRSASATPSTRPLHNGATRISFDRQRAQLENSVRTFRESVQTRTTTASTERAPAANARGGVSRGVSAASGTRSEAAANSRTGVRSSTGTRTVARTTTGNEAVRSTTEAPRTSNSQPVASTPTVRRSGVSQAGTRSTRTPTTTGTWSRFGRSSPARTGTSQTRTTSAGTANLGRAGSTQRPASIPSRTQSRVSSQTGNTNTRTQSSTGGGASNSRVYAPRGRSRVSTTAPPTRSSSRSRTTSAPRSSSSQSRTRTIYTPRPGSVPSSSRSSSSSRGISSTRSAPRPSSSSSSSRSSISSKPSSAPRVSGGVTRSSSSSGVRSQQR